MRRNWLALVLLVAVAGAAYALVGRPPGEPDVVEATEPEAAAPVVKDAVPDGGARLASAGRISEEHRRRARERLEAMWAYVLHLDREGKRAEALAEAERIGKDHPELVAEAANAAVVARLRVALAVQRKEAELKRLLSSAKVSATQREVLDGRLAATAEVLARSGNEADLDQLSRHLRRFLVPNGFASGDPKAPADALLLTFAQDRKARRAQDKNPPVVDTGAAEQRRLDQLEKLRQRDAVGLLDAIHSGLAWLAIHQKDDGSFSDAATQQRCDALGHKPHCLGSFPSTGDSFATASTGLAVLAFLDFRDQDVNGWFDPYLGRGIEYLKKAQKKDGSFPGSGQQYATAICVMALAEAAASTGSQELREAVVKGLAWFESTVGSLGGFRYRIHDAGDLSVTAWVAQAVEMARDAGIPMSTRLVGGFDIFLKYVWHGGAKFSYVDRGGPSATLAPAGMLLGHIVGRDRDPAIAASWRKYLAEVPAKPAPNLYTLYYGVRVWLLLGDALGDPWRAWAFDLAKLQAQGTSASGSFPIIVSGNRPQGIVVPTALAVLTLEHALYLR